MRPSKQERGFNLIEVMVATAMTLALIGGAAAVGVTLQRQASFQEQVMSAQDTNRAFKELLGGAVQRAGAGMGAGRISFGTSGGTDDFRYPVQLRTNANYGGAFRQASAPYANAAFISDSIELSWGDTSSLTELVGCNGGSRVYDGASICTRKRPNAPDALANAMSRNPGNPLPTFFTNPITGVSCLRRLSGLPSDRQAQTLDWSSGNPSGGACALATGDFWNVSTSGVSSLFALPSGGASFRVNWANNNEPVLEMDPDGPAGDLPWQELSREVERLKVRVGVANLTNPNAPLTWFPPDGATTPTLDTCDATCTVPGGLDTQRGDLSTGDAATNTRDALYRRVRMVELDITTRTSRRDVEAIVKDAGGNFLVDAEGFPRDGHKRRRMTVRVAPRNFTLTGSGT